MIGNEIKNLTAVQLLTVLSSYADVEDISAHHIACRPLAYLGIDRAVDDAATDCAWVSTGLIAAWRLRWIVALPLLNGWLACHNVLTGQVPCCERKRSWSYSDKIVVCTVNGSARQTSTTIATNG